MYVMHRATLPRAPRFLKELGQLFLHNRRPPVSQLIGTIMRVNHGATQVRMEEALRERCRSVVHRRPVSAAIDPGGHLEGQSLTKVRGKRSGKGTLHLVNCGAESIGCQRRGSVRNQETW